MKNVITTFTIALLLIPMAHTTLAGDSLSWSGSVGAQREYDSAVGIEQIDDINREGDYAKQASWQLGSKWQATKIWQLAANYQGKNKNYDSFSEYDLDLHHLTLSTKLTINKVDVSYRYDSVKAQLQHNDFLDFEQSTVALSKLYPSSFFMRAALSKNTKDFHDINDRDAEAVAGDLTSMVFFNQNNSHISFSIRLEKETAEQEFYNNNAATVNLGVEHTFANANFPVTFFTGVAYTHKVYDNFNIEFANANEQALDPWSQRGILFNLGQTTNPTQQSNDETRLDTRSVWTTSLTFGLGKHLSSSLKAVFTDNDSNYNSMDYNERVLSIGLKAGF